MYRFDRMKELHPTSILDKEKKDHYRLKNALAQGLYLKSENKTYQQFLDENRNDPENVFFSKEIDKRAFYIYAEKVILNNFLDIRCEKMLLNKDFLDDIKELITAKTETNKNAQDPIGRSVGFTETIVFFKKLLGIQGVEHFEKVIIGNNFYENYIRNLVLEFFNEFKGKTR